MTPARFPIGIRQPRDLYVGNDVGNDVRNDVGNNVGTNLGSSLWFRRPISVLKPGSGAVGNRAPAHNLFEMALNATLPARAGRS